MTGRYDHDEVVLRKSTLDERPALLGLSAAYAVSWSLFAFVANLSMRLGGGGVIILCAATFGLVALAIKPDSPGPVLFFQRRVGRNGHTFRMIKFRSMVAGSNDRAHLDAAGALVRWLIPRPVSRIGRPGSGGWSGWPLRGG